MKKEEKLTRKIKRLLRRIGCPRWLHRFGPKTYELWQHIFAFVVMSICKLSLRRVSKFLSMMNFEVPTYSALCKSRKRISPTLFKKLLEITAEFKHNSVAVDSTGFARTNPSYHNIKRIATKKPIKNFVKLSAFFDLSSKKFTALKVRIKPRHDIKDINYLFKRSSPTEKLFADSAYDAESIHEKCFEKKIQTIIKPKKNVKRGFYRRKQMKNYSEKIYPQRNLIEAGFGSLKRKYGSSVFGKSFKSTNAEIYCKAISHNLNLLR